LKFLCFNLNLLKCHNLIGRLNQPAADGFLPLRAFKPSSSDSVDRGRSIIQISKHVVVNDTTGIASQGLRQKLPAVVKIRQLLAGSADQSNVRY
jgi:hypothetical protein